MMAIEPKAIVATKSGSLELTGSISDTLNQPNSQRVVDIIIPTKLIHDGEMPELIYSKTEDMPRGVGYFCPQQEFAARRQGLQ